MTSPDAIQVCKSCGYWGKGDYCSRCGQPYKVKRITLRGLLHDVFHFFTHLEKGFGYTLKQLIVAPGRMQRAYIEGERGRHQKPFSMFFICATVAGVGRYWIYQTLLKYYGAGNAAEVSFFHEYMVLMQIVLLPLYTLIVYLFFYKAGYNYAELGVLMLYNVSFFFLNAVCISLLKFIWPQLDTAYVELPVLLLYSTVTFIYFFYKQPRWLVALKSICIVLIIFFLVQYLEDFVIQVIH